MTGNTLDDKCRVVANESTESSVINFILIKKNLTTSFCLTSLLGKFVPIKLHATQKMVFYSKTFYKPPGLYSL